VAADPLSDGNPPIRLICRREIGRNSRWIVYFDHIEDDAGRRVDDFLTIAGLLPDADLLTGVAVLPVRGDEVGLLSSYRHPIGRSAREVVKGFIDAGETPAEAAHRELLEETGCTAGTLVALGMLTPEASTLAARTALFLALDCVAEHAPETDELGLGALSWYREVEALRMLDRSEIEDCYTVICLLRLERWRRARLTALREDPSPCSMS